MAVTVRAITFSRGRDSPSQALAFVEVQLQERPSSLWSCAISRRSVMHRVNASQRPQLDDRGPEW